jgi:mono/diheme cytochrome c family protein
MMIPRRSIVTKRKSSLLVLGVIGLFSVSLTIVGVKSFGEENHSKKSENRSPSSFVVTPVQGPSWIHHLGIFDLSRTAMGKMGGLEPPFSSQRQEPNFSIQYPSSRGRGMMGGGMGMGGMMGRIYSNYRSDPEELMKLMNEKFFLTGVDLYRLNCQSCHGPYGHGSPPEINALIGPVEGTSPALIKARMKKWGRPIDDQLARELASQAEASIRERLQKGGKKMPPFNHLDGEEVNALFQYLQKHVGALKEGEKDLRVTQSVARVGEHLTKGTCHICHDTVGPGSGRMAAMRGIIPSLASFPYEQSIQSVVRQVEFGTMRMMMMMSGQRMPAFPYITEDEAAAAYLYLVRYQP